MIILAQNSFCIYLGKIALDFEPPPPQQISARQRAKF